MTHPQRCETCQKDCEITVIDADTKKPISFNPQELREPTLWFVQGINQVGCASHSSAPVPEGYKDKIVDKLCEMCRGTLSEYEDIIVDNCDIRKSNAICKLCDRISNELIEELRQERKQEQP